MDEDHKLKHICKYCKKRFPCGRSLGGHMRSHMNTSTEIEEVNNTFMVGYDQNGTTHTGYGLRENPKKTWRSVSDSRKRGNFIGEKVCEECGKGFQSQKAYMSHLKSFHSQMYDEKSQSLEEFGGEEVEQVEEEDYWSDHKLEENQNLVMDSQSDNEATAPKRRRSKRTRYKNTNTIITPSINNNNNTTSCLSVANSSVSEISNEQEVAMSLMMLSRDASGYHRSELNCLVESSDNNSLFLEAKSSSLTKRTNENELNLNEKKKLKGKKKLGVSEAKVTRFDGKRSELGGCYGSGLSRNGIRNGESEVPASFGEEGEKFKKPKFDDELENSSYTRNRANSKITRAESGKNLIREVENQSSFKYGKFNSSKRAKFDLYGDKLDRDMRKKAKYDDSDSEFCKASSKKSKYKCTTCNKYFPSYQALGGHRASHKKIKGCSASKVDFSETSIETDFSPADIKSCNTENVKEFEVTASVETSPGLKKNKHECPICFKEFRSGQALGGHKRSHLVGGSDTRSNPTIIIQQKLPVVRDLLDLNLPAPNDEETNTSNMGYEPWWVGNSHKHEQLVGLISN
ncbi:hypothetical protein MKX01_008612 [Papaver californicum]|nr:hypothetical protein MKX01_008612 [Papaver californicum]